MAQWYLNTRGPIHCNYVEIVASALLVQLLHSRKASTVSHSDQDVLISLHALFPLIYDFVWRWIKFFCLILSRWLASASFCWYFGWKLDFDLIIGFSIANGHLGSWIVRIWNWLRLEYWRTRSNSKLCCVRDTLAVMRLHRKTTELYQKRKKRN